MTGWVSGARLPISRDAGLPPAPRLPRSWLTSRRRTISERSLTDNQGQIGMLLTLSAVRSRRHSYHSQADTAGSIPVTPLHTRKTLQQNRAGRSSSLPMRVPGPCAGHFGPHLSTPRDSPSRFRGAQLVPSWISPWGWQDGMRPSPDAPVWPMDAFRDRFLNAYGPNPPTTPLPSDSPSQRKRL